MPTLTDYQDDLARYTDEAEQYRSRAELARREHRRREAEAEKDGNTPIINAAASSARYELRRQKRQERIA